MHSSDRGTVAAMVFRSFSSADRWSGFVSARYSPTVSYLRPRRMAAPASASPARRVVEQCPGLPAGEQAIDVLAGDFEMPRLALGLEPVLVERYGVDRVLE